MYLIKDMIDVKNVFGWFILNSNFAIDMSKLFHKGNDSIFQNYF